MFRVKSSSVKIINLALGKHIGVAKFYVCVHEASSSLVLPDSSSKWFAVKRKILGVHAEKIYDEIEVSVTTIDHLVAENKVKNIHLLKIDTEGAELDVLKGAVKSLREGIIKNIQIESHNNSMRNNNKIEIYELLSNYTHQKSIKHYFGNFTEEFFSLG